MHPQDGLTADASQQLFCLPIIDSAFAQFPQGGMRGTCHHLRQGIGVQSQFNHPNTLCFKLLQQIGTKGYGLV